MTSALTFIHGSVLFCECRNKHITQWIADVTLIAGELTMNDAGGNAIVTAGELIMNDAANDLTVNGGAATVNVVTNNVALANAGDEIHS